VDGLFAAGGGGTSVGLNVGTGKTLAVGGTLTVTGSASIAFAAGTVSAPSITANGDTNTGIFFPAADTIAFTEGGVEAARFDSSGNLGIGTSAPATKLDVLDGTANGNVGTPIARVVGANQAITSETGTLSLQSNSNMAVDTGGSIIFGGRGTTASTNSISYGHIAGRKENGTSANFAGYLQFGTSDAASDITEKMRLDSSGNLGLGVTPSAWQSGVKAFQNGAGALYTINTVQQRLSLNAYRDSAGTMRYINSSINAAEFRMGEGDGSFQFHTAASGTAGNTISFTQAMTLDASGQWLLGGTSLDNPQSWGRIAQVINSGSNGAAISVKDANNEFNIATYNSALIIADGATERARITSGGVFCVNSTSNIGAEVTLFKQTSGVSSPATRFWNNATTGDNEFVEFATETSYTARGSITYNRGGGLVAYNTTSDYRAKNIIGPVQDSGATIDALKVYEGQMKGATQSRPMLIAHEAQEHAPYAVTGEKDAVNEDGTPKYQQMDVSALVPLLLAEIQSLRARVAQLESK
jgi:hypothetical protein